MYTCIYSTLVPLIVRNFHIYICYTGILNELRVIFYTTDVTWLSWHYIIQIKIYFVHSRVNFKAH